MKSLALKFSALLERYLDDIDETDEMPGMARIPAGAPAPARMRGNGTTVFPWPLAGSREPAVLPEDPRNAGLAAKRPRKLVG